MSFTKSRLEQTGLIFLKNFKSGIYLSKRYQEILEKQFFKKSNCVAHRSHANLLTVLVPHTVNSAFLAVLECKNPLWKFSNPTLQPRSELRARKIDFFQRLPKIAKSLHMPIFRPDMRFSVLKDIKNLNLNFSRLFDFQLKTGSLV